jgi:hypothetical protein
VPLSDSDSASGSDPGEPAEEKLYPEEEKKTTSDKKTNKYEA